MTRNHNHHPHHHGKDKSHSNHQGRMLPSMIPLFIFVPDISPEGEEKDNNNENRYYNYSLHASSSSLSSQQSFPQQQSRSRQQSDRWTSSGENHLLHHHHQQTPCASSKSAATTAKAIAAPRYPLRLRSDLTGHVDDDVDDDKDDTRDEVAMAPPSATCPNVPSTTNNNKGGANHDQEDSRPKLPHRSWTLPTNTFPHNTCATTGHHHHHHHHETTTTPANPVEQDTQKNATKTLLPTASTRATQSSSASNNKRMARLSMIPRPSIHSKKNAAEAAASAPVAALVA